MANLPETYKAVVVTEPNGAFELKDLELKHPEAGQVLVKVLACGFCWTDIEVSRGMLGPDIFPSVPGHEIIGDVVELGIGINHFQIGDRVGGTFHGGHDLTCRSCQRGQFQHCEAAIYHGVTAHGGFAEYIILRGEAVVRIPEEMDPAEAAPLMCAGVTVFNSIRKQRLEQGGLIAIQGMGGLGHLAVQYARKMGYEVAVLSSGSDKEPLAKQLGAHYYINTKAQDAPTELALLGGADIIVQTAPSADVIGNLIGGLSAHGSLLSLAPAGQC